MIALLITAAVAITSPASPAAQSVLNDCIASVAKRAKACARKCKRLRVRHAQDICESPCKLAHAHDLIVCFEVAS